MSNGTARYSAAGVDLAKSVEARSRIAQLVASTRTAGVIGGPGGFGGMFRMPEGYARPVLVSSADGVGTKLRVAIEADTHSTIGRDLVNHCVNDILVQGAAPLFFLDYLAFGRLDPDVATEVVRGVTEGCRENGCALVGGETAEMPGMYTPPDYDLAGFIVGAVEEDRIPGPERVRSGDAIIALESSGLHTNGYALARRIVFEKLKLRPGDPFPGMDSAVSEVLLTVHRSYLRALEPVLDRVHAMAHITGGGIPGNLDRALPPGVAANVNLSSWEIPAVFKALASGGDLSREEMFRVFNMGVGMMVIASAADADSIIQSARIQGTVGWIAGDISHGSGNVNLV